MAAHGTLPRYLQISELLIRDIASGRLLDGERLPPERQMAAGLGLAVGTLRQALFELETRGLLERIHGSGNYVRSNPDAASVYAFFRLELPEGGGLPTATVLSITRLEKPDDLPEFGTSNAAHRIRRLRYLSGRLAALEEIWLDGSYIDVIAPESLSESLYLYFRFQLGLWIARVEDSVSQSAVPEWAPPAFGMAPGLPAPFVSRIGWAGDGRRAEVSRTWFDPAHARYVARLK